MINMKVSVFIGHIKHTSVNIKLIGYESEMFIYSGTVGSYQHWIHKDEVAELDIAEINFDSNDNMCIYLEGA